ncbi:MAG: tandem-95 repeat protein, partial [Bacteriovoracaceae bacterium]|nr:tandem-95 repeat protein [Bacteriovoracaceae bacterium]
MNGFMKKLFLLSLVLFTLFSCVPAQVGVSEKCGANEAYDAVKRACYKTIVPLQAPKPTLSNLTIVEDSPATTVTLTYSDVDGDKATACSTFNHAEGIDDVIAICICTAGTCTTTITPDPDFFGYSEFFYTVTDTNGVSVGQSVSVSVTGANDAPIALNGNFSTDEGLTSPVLMDISSLGSDPDLDRIYFVKISDPLDGVITAFDQDNGTFSYLPPVDNYGVYSFLFKICDYGSPTLCSSNKTISITVNPIDDAPVANDISKPISPAYSGVEDAAVVINLDFTDAEGDTATGCNVLSTTTLTAISCVCAGGLCQATFTPDSDFNSDLGSTASFTYNVIAGGLTSNSATATVSLAPVNDAPILSYNPAAVTSTVDENSTVTFSTVEDLSNDQFAVILDVDEGGGIYEDSQTLSINVQWANTIALTPEIVSKVDIYYNASLIGTFSTGTDTTTYLNIVETGDFDPHKLAIKAVPAVDMVGQVGITMRVKDDAGSLVVDPGNTVNVTFKIINDPPGINGADQFLPSLTINEADIRYTAPITITEDVALSDSEKSDDIWVAIETSNTVILPLTAAAIRVFSQYSNPDTGITDLKQEIPWPGVAGCGKNWFLVDSSRTLAPTIYDEDNSHYKVILKLDSANGISGTSNVTVYAMDRDPTTDPDCLMSQKSFTFTVNPIGATHGGWTKISAYGHRENRDGKVSFNGKDSAYVDLGWNTFNTINSGTGSAENISGWHIFRRTTGEEYDFTKPITDPAIPANTLTYQDTAVDPNTTYYYTVRAVDSSGSNYTIPTEEIFSEVRLFVPGKNTAFIHRWMMNKEVCTKMLATEGGSDPLKTIDPLNSYRCRFEGPGESLDWGADDLVGTSDDLTYYDIGHDLLVDVVELGCPYSTNLVEPACGANGCIGTDHLSVTPSAGISFIYYNRSSGICYHNNIAGVWSPMDSATLAASFTDKSSNVYLPPLVNISQKKANEFCKTRTDVTGTGLDSDAKYTLPTRLEQIAYSAWNSDYLYTKINELEKGQFLNAESKCNSSAASGVEAGYTDVAVPPTSYLYSLPGTNLSQIRSIYTGSQSISDYELTASCLSRYGIQDVYGNVAEWTRDRFLCFPESQIDAFDDYTCSGLLERFDNKAHPGGEGLYTTGQSLSNDQNKIENHYDVIDPFYDYYKLDGVRGPCYDASGSGSSCTAPMKSWYIYKETYFAGAIIFPMGLPMDKDFASTYDFFGPSNYVLDIGSTAGIKSDDLHNDTFSLNTYPIMLSDDGTADPDRERWLAGMATGGSYDTSSDSGRYSMELVPTTPSLGVEAKLSAGSSYVHSQVGDRVLHYSYIKIDNKDEIEILSQMPLAGVQLTVNVVDSVAPISASYNSITRTLQIKYDSTNPLHFISDVVTAINGALDSE